MERRIAASVEIEEAIEAVLLEGLDDPDHLAELGRACYERTPDARGSRNGHRPKRVQTAEGEITIAVPPSP